MNTKIKSSSILATWVEEAEGSVINERKRSGFSKTPLKTIKEINVFVDSITDEELKYFHAYGGFCQTPAESIMILAREIQSFDSQFQNLRSEVAMAESVAKQIFERYELIKDLIPQIADEEAAVVIQGLRVMNYMYMRVLGDKLCSYKLENGDKFDLETAIKTLWECDELKIKNNRNQLRKILLGVKIPKDAILDSNTINKI